MADSFWKALGSKLVETGSAYLQQARLVNELKQLSAEEARARFAQYVQGMSGTARAGFQVTLALLANNERSAEAKRFIEALRTALANPGRSCRRCRPRPPRHHPRRHRPPRRSRPAPRLPSKTILTVPPAGVTCRTASGARS